MTTKFYRNYGIIALLAAASIGGFASRAVAADCDFDTQIGNCTGTIAIVQSKGSKGHYSAELKVKSSARTCSRVEYYVDNTPYSTVLSGSNTEPESIFGTSPISSRNIQVEQCKAFADRAAGGGKVKSGADAFSGRWKGTVGWMLFSSSLELTISVTQNRASGVGHFGNGHTITFDDGAISNNTLTYTYAEPATGKIDVVHLVKDAEGNLDYSATNGATVSGKLTRE